MYYYDTGYTPQDLQNSNIFLIKNNIYRGRIKKTNKNQLITLSGMVIA